MIKVECIKRLSFGLFSIEPGSTWVIDGIKYDRVPMSCSMRLSEYKNDGMWVEIPQKLFADSFSKVEDVPA